MQKTISAEIWRKLGGNSKKIQDNIEKCGGTKFWRGKGKREKVPGEEPLARTLKLNQLFIYLFIYLFIGNKPHSTIYSFVPNKFIHLFKQKFYSLVTVDPVISNYHPKPDFPHHHCLQYKSMSQIIPVDSFVTLYFWMTLQETYVGVTKGDYRTQAL